MKQQDHPQLEKKAADGANYPEIGYKMSRKPLTIHLPTQLNATSTPRYTNNSLLIDPLSIPKSV